MWIPKTIHSLTEKLVLRGSGFLQLLIAIRLLESVELGSYFLALSIFFYFSAIREGVLKPSYITLSAGNENSQNYFTATVLMGIVFSAAGSVIVFFISPLAGSLFQSESTATLLQWLSILLVTELPLQLAVWQNHKMENFRAPVILRIVEQSSLFITLALLYLYGIRDAKLFIIARIVGSIVASILSLKTVLIYFNMKRVELHEIIIRAKEIYNFGKFSVATLISSRLYRSADLYLLAIFLGEEAVAFYGIAARMSDYVEIPLQAVGDRIFPKIASLIGKGDIQAASEVTKKAVGHMALVTVPATLILLLFPAQLLRIFTGESYSEAVTLVRIWGVFTLFRPLDRLTGITLDALKLPAINMNKTVLATVTNIVCNTIILSLFSSMEGVAVVSLFTQIGGILLGYHYIRKERHLFRFRSRELSPMREPSQNCR